MMMKMMIIILMIMKIFTKRVNMFQVFLFTNLSALIKKDKSIQTINKMTEGKQYNKNSDICLLLEVKTSKVNQICD